MQKRKRNKPNWVKITYRIIIYLCSVFLCGLIFFLKGFDFTRCLSYTVMMGVGTGIVFVMMALFEEKNLLNYDNKSHVGRFYLIWMISLGFSIGVSFLPITGWPYLFVFVLLSLYSNTLIGMASGIMLLSVSVILSGADINVFLLYLFAGLVGIVMFSKLDENYRIGFPLMVSSMMLLTTLTAGSVLFENSKLKLELFVIPFLNVVISTILLLVLLKVFSATVIFKYRDIYLEITDPEYMLMVQLKEKSKADYYKVIHTAYFCDRICKRLGTDSDACKTAAYYHIIGQMTEHQRWEEIFHLCIEHRFPTPAIQILEEYLNPDCIVQKKETAVLLFSEGVISSILYLMHNEDKTKLDYNQIIETVFKTKLQSKKLDHCILTLEELNLMKNIFKEEKLYYDFLH